MRTEFNCTPLMGLPLKSKERRVKEFFEARGLTPPQSIGNLEEGIPEIEDVVQLSMGGGFFANIEVMIRWNKEAEPLPFVMRSSVGKADARFVPLIDGKIAIIKQWSPPLGKFTWEIPRGFCQDWKSWDGNPLGASAIPAGFTSTLKELTDEVSSVEGVIPQLLGAISEDSGSTTTSVDYWLLRIGSINIGPTEGGVSIKLVPVPEVEGLLGGRIADTYSITAIALALKVLGR